MERHDDPAPQPSVAENDSSLEDAVDEVIAQSFPASDPPQWWAGAPD